MIRRPKVVAFDIIETVFRIEPLGERIAKLGLPESAYARLYAEALRDAVSLACIGRFSPFVEVFRGALAGMLGEIGRTASEAELTAALSVLRELPPQPGAREAFRLLGEGGIRVVALSNGAASASRSLLDRAGMSDLAEHVLSVESVQLAKPRGEVYRHALDVTGVRPDEAMLVACHPWDITGAKAVGFLGGYVARGKPYPAVMTPPDVTGEDLIATATAILALPA